MKNRPEGDSRAASSFSDSKQPAKNVLSDQPTLLQVPPSPQSIADELAGDGIHVGSIWKSPRDKTTCIQAKLRSFNECPYLDVRVFQLDERGRMKPTSKGVTVSVAKIGGLSKLVGDAYRKALAIGLVGGSS